MSSTLTIKDLISIFNNNCSIVSSTRLDKTLEVLISKYTNRNLLKVVEYLNKLKVIYYSNRLDSRDSSISKEYKGTTYIYIILK